MNQHTHDVREPHDGIGDDDKDATTGGTTRFQRVLSWVQAGNDTRWMATQVCPRSVGSGLGGHDAGVSGVGDEGDEKALIPLWKRGRLALSESTTFRDFVPARKDNASENPNPTNTTTELSSIHDMGCR